MKVAVLHEPRMYEPDGPFSYYQDISTVAAGGTVGEARDRLDRHQQEVHHEIEERTPEGLRAAEELRKANDPETRAASTSTLAGFTTPQFIIDQYALYRGIHRSFIDQTNLMPLPRTGMAMHIPVLTSATTDAQQAENAAVSEADSTGSDLLSGVPVQTIAGQFQFSLQLYDRAFGGGGAFDAVVAAQLQQSLDQNVDLYALNQAISNGNTVTGAGTWAWGTFYSDLASGREVLTDTAGVRYRPTHVFTTSDFHNYVTRQLDTQNRPIVTPSETPGKPLNDDEDESRWEGFTGVILPGTTMWFFDDNIPASGANTQIIVSRPDTILSLESEPTLRVFTETYGTTLTVVAQLYKYACVIPRFPNATATISGAAYPTTLK